MRRSLAGLLALLCLAACGDSSSGPSGGGRVQVGLPVFGSVAVGADSLRDTLVVELRRGGALVHPTWVKATATSGTVTPALGRTAQGRLALEWRLARPAAGAQTELRVCPATAQGACTEDAMGIVTHSGP